MSLKTSYAVDVADHADVPVQPLLARWLEEGPDGDGVIEEGDITDPIRFNHEVYIHYFSIGHHISYILCTL